MPRVPDRACGVVADALVKLREARSSNGKHYVELMLCYRDKEESATMWLEVPNKN